MQQRAKFAWQLSLIALLGLTGLGMAIFPAGAIASERIVLKYLVFRRSVAVDDLTEFAATGKTTRPLRTYLRMSGQNPEEIRKTLTDEVQVNVVVLDRVLNSPVGDVVLEQLGQYIYTPSQQEDKKAMRSALILSASNDSRISLLEIMQNYPTQEVHIDGNRIREAYQQLENIDDTLGNLLQQLEQINLNDIRL
jgi:hypothetical protein